jgi:hypothetical protein
LSDPWIKWDADSSRFFAGIFDISLGGEIIAVSQTSNPSGTWFLYRIQYPSTAGGITAGGCPDQGKGGVDKNVVGLGFNEFSESGVAGCPNAATFQGAGLEVFNKSQMLAGATVNFVFTDPLPTFFSLVPADTLTASATTEYFASLDSGTGTALHRVTSVGVPPATVTLSAPADITVPSYSNPPAATQKGTTTKIDSGDDRTQNVVVLGTKMTVTQTIGCKPSGDTTTRSCGRVYEVNNGTNTLKASRTISASGKYFFYPAATLVGDRHGRRVDRPVLGHDVRQPLHHSRDVGRDPGRTGAGQGRHGDQHHHAIRRLQRRRPQVGHDQPVLGGR